MKKHKSNCFYCKKNFSTKKNPTMNALTKGNIKKYCNKKCRYLALGISEPINVTCLNCKKEFKKLANKLKKTPNSFCSQSCSATYNNTHKTKGYRRSKLEIYLEKTLNEKYKNIIFHFNKKDAINSELDIYIPSMKLAFELNGIFHYEPIFGEKTLDKIKNNDNRKFQACLERGIELCIIDVSSLSYFKPTNAQKYLDIVFNLIDSKMAGVVGVEPT